MANIKKKRTVIDPFEDEDPVEITYHRVFSVLSLAQKMPKGLVERIENGNNLTGSDMEFLKYVLDRYTNWTYEENIAEKTLKTSYILNVTLNSILNEEYKEWEEFKEEVGQNNEGFLNAGALGVTND